MNDQQRGEAWAALHRPETSPETLSRIANDHPEFAAAIAAHPNAYPGLKAWAQSRAGQQPQQHGQPQSQVQSQSQIQPQVQPQQPHSYAAPTTAPGSARPYSPAPAGGLFNVMGAIGLGVMVLSALFSFAIPFLLRTASMNYNMTLFSLATGGVQWAAIIIGGVFGVIGVVQKQRQRGRWMAYAALGAAGCSAIASFASLLGNLAAGYSYY